MALIYYGTQDCLTNKEAYHLKKYYKRVSLFTSGRFTIDPAIFTLVNLDCQNCRAVHLSSCCEGGQPYSMDRTSQNQLNLHAPFIIENYLAPERKEEAGLNGYMEEEGFDIFSPAIKLCDGDCFFLAKESGQSYCSIHRYALEQQMSPWQLKPYSCSLFPLDIIQEDSHIFVTAITPETASFSRWGHDYEGYLCIDIHKRKGTAALPAEIFSSDQYRPAWEWCEELLQMSLGDELIKLIIQMKKEYDKSF